MDIQVENFERLLYLEISLHLISRLGRAQIIAVAIETSFQNASIAFILLKISLQEPYGELAAVAPVAQLCVTGLPLWFIFFALKIYQKCCKKQETENDAEKEESRQLKSQITTVTTVSEVDKME